MFNHTYVAFDIETVSDPDYIEFLKKNTPMKNCSLKGPTDFPSEVRKIVDEKLRAEREAEYTKRRTEEIEQWRLKERQKILDKAPLHWTTGKVICISCIELIHPDRPRVWSGDNEAKVLTGAFDFISQLTQPILVGKSSRNFDVPFVIGRAMKHRLGIPSFLRLDRPDPLHDVDQIFGWGQKAPQAASLDNYCRALGLPSKKGTGAMVQDWYAEILCGDLDKWKTIQEYCLDDSVKVAEILSLYARPYKSSKFASASTGQQAPEMEGVF
jgi:hypothetical protein